MFLRFRGGRRSPRAWGGLRLLEGTNHQQNQLKQEPSSQSPGGRDPGPHGPHACEPHMHTHMHTHSPRHQGIQGRGKKQCLRPCPGHMFVWKGAVSGLACCIAAFCSLRLSGISAFFCGTLHAPLIHSLNKKYFLHLLQ